MQSEGDVNEMWKEKGARSEGGQLETAAYLAVFGAKHDGRGGRGEEGRGGAHGGQQQDVVGVHDHHYVVVVDARRARARARDRLSPGTSGGGGGGGGGGGLAKARVQGSDFVRVIFVRRAQPHHAKRVPPRPLPFPFPLPRCSWCTAAVVAFTQWCSVCAHLDQACQLRGPPEVAEPFCLVAGHGHHMHRGPQGGPAGLSPVGASPVHGGVRGGDHAATGRAGHL